MRRLAAGLYVLAILVATLTPVGSIGWDPSGLAFCIICGQRGTADAFLNVLLFVPVGALLVRDLGIGRTFLLGALLSLSVETVQLWIPGRYSAVSDLLFNGSGAGVGAILTRLPLVSLLPGAGKDPAASDSTRMGSTIVGARADTGLHRVLTLAWTGAAVLFLLAAGLLLRTTVTDAALYGQWMPDLGRGVYEGRILEATVGGMAVPSRRVEDQDGLRTLLEEDAPVEVRFVAGPPPRSLAPVFNVFDGRRQAILSLATDGSELVYYRRYVADDLRLDRPDFRVRDALADVEVGDTVEIRVARAGGGGYRVTVEREGRGAGGFAWSAPLVHTPARSWSLFLYSGEGSPSLRRLVDGLWLAFLVFPVGLWAPSFRSLALSAGFLLAALPVSAALSPLVVTPFGAYGAALTGLLLGRAFRFAIATYRRRSFAVRE